MISIRHLAATVVAAAVVGGALLASSAGAADAEATLAQVRRATARYHDPALAVADGYVPTTDCVAFPGVGAMGLHYVHPARMADPAIDATKPEALLYEARPNGMVRLIAVEWVAVDPDQDLSTAEGRPSVAGVPFDGPMPGHEPGMPIHFDLHAWIWKHNPAGTFAPWIPAVTCDA